jgi:hypothetical protein
MAFDSFGDFLRKRVAAHFHAHGRRVGDYLNLQITNPLTASYIRRARRLPTLGLRAWLPLGSALVTLLSPCMAGELAATGTAEVKAGDGGGLTRITMKCQNAAPKPLLEELALAADIKLDTANTAAWASARTVTLDVKDRPFWPVFIEACRQARLQFVSDKEHRLRLVGVENCLGERPMFEAEECLLIIQRASHEHKIHYGSAYSGYSRTSDGSVPLRLSGRLLMDPGFRLVGEIGLTLSNAVDENGTSLLGPQVSYFLWNTDKATLPTRAGLGFSVDSQVDLQLRFPTNGGRLLSRLEGTLRLPTALKSQTWELADVLNAKPQSREYEGQRITVESVRKKDFSSSYPDCNYEVKFSFKEVDENAPGLLRQSGLYPSVLSMNLVTADGVKFRYSSLTVHSERRQGSCVVSFDASNTNDIPWKLVWNVPVDVHLKLVPFTITNVPIP